MKRFYKTQAEQEETRQDIEDLPKTLKLNHPLDVVKQVLGVLEAVEFRWTVKDVLDQDESWIEDILLMKSIGEDWKHIREEEQEAKRQL